ncbi:dihydrofolate reductase [Vagococcus xieshaowenii]|uniref:Dihydrofolate reductase n=1 Tax=Vagococcus xieshaowenii TaxID=2562451 RepID=A0AAJ5JLK4_9ENTE|nr:dihydrofolate reductase [Vagococcus xieshaowenii]QCA28699.1 dihydrofolate reductase [Vagococcus xieshaowenii]TFZ40492.1 dihydrofolate reductase [Vagococcus xieshaowenii]
MFAAIWAQDENRLIGNNDQMPWYLPNDLQFFKTTTENNTIVMGRTTFEGMNKQPLPNRQTIVLTSDENYEAEGVIVMHSVDEVVAYEKNYEGIVFITGGAKVYQAFLPLCDIVYRTVIHESFEGNVFIPDIDFDRWSMIDVSDGVVDEKNKYPHSFETFKRKK